MYEFDMSSEIFGSETFSGYETREAAESALRRVSNGAQQLNDGIERTFSAIREVEKESQHEHDRDEG